MTGIWTRFYRLRGDILCRRCLERFGSEDDLEQAEPVDDPEAVCIICSNLLIA